MNVLSVFSSNISMQCTSNGQDQTRARIQLTIHATWSVLFLHIVSSSILFAQDSRVEINQKSNQMQTGIFAPNYCLQIYQDNCTTAEKQVKCEGKYIQESLYTGEFIYRRVYIQESLPLEANVKSEKCMNRHHLLTRPGESTISTDTSTLWMKNAACRPCTWWGRTCWTWGGGWGWWWGSRPPRPCSHPPRGSG